MSSYGEAKKRDMARSILPCTARKTFRELIAGEKRASRSRVNQELSLLRGPAKDVAELYEDSATDYNQYPNREINSLVWERRECDKVAPVMKWAVVVTDGVRKEDRLSRFAAMMPDSTIGRHAVDHVAWMEEFRVGHPHEWTYRSRVSSVDPEVANFIRYAAIAALVERMELLFERNGALKRFNQSDAAYRLERKKIEHIKYAESLGIPRWRVHYDRRTNEYYYLNESRFPLTMKSQIPGFLSNFVIGGPDHRYFSTVSKFEKLDEILKKIGV